MSVYYRPLVRNGPRDGAQGKSLAGGAAWFDTVAVHSRDAETVYRAAADIPADALEALTSPRAPIAGLDMSRSHVMGILNVTPDSFSDGGQFLAADAAVSHAHAMAQQGAAIIDIGGESTRPGAKDVPAEEEQARTAPVIAAIRQESAVPISIDTRKSTVAQAAITAGADIVNDVAAFTYDPLLAKVAAQADVPVCLMHAQGTPATMQSAPHYDDVLLDVYDFLESRIAAAEGAGIARSRIIVDPGIGFGKTLEHNLILLRGLSLFHGLGCPILLGASRKRFIGTIGGGDEATARLGGSVAVALHGVRQGAQILRVHDIFETRQAIDLERAISGADDK